MSRAISSQKTSNTGCLIAFLSLFVLVGLLLFVFLFAVPAFNIWRAASWPAVPCLINSSTVEVNRGSDDTSYFPQVAYSYSINGQQYTAERFSFFKLEWSNTAEPQAIVNAFPAGATLNCYVDPANPENAVLDRSLPAKAWTNLLSLIFVVVAGGCIYLVVRSERAGKRGLAIGQSSWRPQPSGRSLKTTDPREVISLPVSGEVTLQPTFPPIGVSCGLGLFALFWNGFIGFFFVQFITGARNGGFTNIFMILFMIPFVLVGIIVFLAALSSFGSLFVSRPVLIASSATQPLGGVLNLRWEMKRGGIKPKTIKIWLEAREEATYTRGTDTVTDKSIFYSQLVCESQPGGPQSGNAAIQIPANVMHSFDAKHNKIVWSLKAKGDVTYWPNFEEEYRIVVTPHAPGAVINS